MNDLYERQQKAYMLAHAGGIAFNPVQFFEDQFTGTNGTALTSHVSDSGHGWLNHSGTGTWTIGTNRVWLATAGRVAIVDMAPPTPHYYVEAAIENLSDVTDNIGVIGRQTPSGVVNCYLWRYDRNADTWDLIRMVNGVSGGNLGTFADNWTTGSRTARLEMVGNSIKGYTQGVLRVSAIDNTYSDAGSFGIRGTTVMTASTHHPFTSLIAAGNAA